MPFITTPERYGREAGLKEGEIITLRSTLKMILADKFGPAGRRLARGVNAVGNAARLKLMFSAASKAATLDDVRPLFD